MLLSMTCSNCAKGFRVKAELAGKKVKCAHCGHILLVAQT